MRIKIFVDSSVLFAAILSATGHARDLIRYAIAGRVQLVTSEYVLSEVTHNLAVKHPRVAYLLDQFVTEVAFEVIEATREEVLAAAEYTALKDAPIVAAAVKARCDCLATFDRKHLLNPPEVAERSGLTIATPGTIVKLLSEREE